MGLHRASFEGGDSGLVSADDLLDLGHVLEEHHLALSQLSYVPAQFRYIPAQFGELAPQLRELPAQLREVPADAPRADP